VLVHEYLSACNAHLRKILLSDVELLLYRFSTTFVSYDCISVCLMFDTRLSRSMPNRLGESTKPLLITPTDAMPIGLATIRGKLVILATAGMLFASTSYFEGSYPIGSDGARFIFSYMGRVSRLTNHRFANKLREHEVSFQPWPPFDSNPDESICFNVLLSSLDHFLPSAVLSYLRAI
jgi:hypothetical protein